MTQSKMPFAFNLSKLPGQVLAWPKKGKTFFLPSLIKSDSFCCWNYLTSTPSPSWCYRRSVTRPSLGSQSFLISSTNYPPTQHHLRNKCQASPASCYTSIPFPPSAVRQKVRSLTRPIQTARIFV